MIIFKVQEFKVFVLCSFLNIISGIGFQLFLYSSILRIFEKKAAA